jgi:hypothetical protein
VGWFWFFLTKVIQRQEVSASGDRDLDAYNQYVKDRHKSYVDQRKNMDSLAFQMGTQHDQWVLTLSGGALGLSITFLDKIVSHPDQWTKWLLFLAWAAFAVALLAAFQSIHYSHLAITRQLAILDEEHVQFLASTSKEKPEGTVRSPPQSSNKFVKVTQRWSLSARSFTIAGIALFCLFCFCNIRASLTSSDTPVRTEIILSTDPDLFKLLQSYKEKANMSEAPKPQTKSYVPPTNQIATPPPKPLVETYVPPTNTIPPPAPKQGK